MTPERLYLETKWVSLIPYQKTADLLHDVLPIAAKPTGAAIQQHLHAAVKAQEQQLPAEVPSFQGGCQLEREALPRPARTLVVGLGDGYVRHWHKKGCFEVLRSRGLLANQQVEFFTDGAPVLRSLEQFWSSCTWAM